MAFNKSQKIGEVLGTRGEGHFEWKIHDFFMVVSDEKVKDYNSPEFSFLHSCWYLQVTPYGDEESNVWVGLHLCIKDERKNSAMNANCTIGIKKANGEEEILCEHNCRMKYWPNDPVGGLSKCIKFANLKSRHSELLPSDNLTVTCTLRFGMQPRGEGVEILVQNVKDLFLNGEYSDVVMRVEGKEFKAHMAILAARSPVFAGMFEHDMAEKNCGTVDIPDCTAVAFEAFLLYLYTGNVDSCPPDAVPLLYYAADKYGVPDLKARCIRIMKKSLSVDCFCDIVALSQCHEECELLEAAARFLRQNEEVIIESAQWHTFLQEYPIQANEIYMEAMEY